jgi:hypothetical protein
MKSFCANQTTALSRKPWSEQWHGAIYLHKNPCKANSPSQRSYYYGRLVASVQEQIH